MENKKQEQTIEIGTLATGWYFQDLYPFEVIAITPSGKTVTIRRLDSTPAEGYDYLSNQIHTFTSNPENEVIQVRKRKNGWGKGNLKVNFGHATEYRNPSF